MEPTRRADGYLEGTGIHWSAVEPKDPVASLALVHGYGDHGGRYGPLVDRLASSGIATFLVDLRGHGRSEGRRGYVRRFEDYLDEVEEIVRLAAGASPWVFLLGHSFGGLLVLRYLLERREAVQGAVLSAPFLALAFEPPGWKVALGKALRAVAPWASIPSGITPEMLTSDPTLRREAEEDPLFFTTTTPGWYFEAIRAQGEVMERAKEIRVPLLGLVPLGDPVASPTATTAFFERVGSADRRLVPFPGALHEVFNEVPTFREEAFREVTEWILAHADVDRRQGLWQRG